MKKVKSSVESRTISIETLNYDDLPKKAKEKMYYATIKKFSFNRGGQLVNSGLNTFVQDVFVSRNEKTAIYSDRFNNFYSIKDTKIIKCLANSSKATITDEGILIFYSSNTDNDIYFTLNFKFGILIKFSDLISYYDSNIQLFEIFSLYGKTFAKIGIHEGRKIMVNKYYLLDFSFNFFESYGTTIKIKFYDLNEKIKSKKDITKDFKFEVESCKIYKNRSVIKLNEKLEEYELKKLTSNPDTSYLENNEKIKSYEYTYAKSICIYYEKGNIGINDCINSFTHHIRYIITPVRKKFNFSSEYKLYLISRQDRFQNTDFYRVQKNDIFNNILCSNDSKYFVSLEGVIVILKLVAKQLFVYLSLDGFIWISYDISHLIDSDSDYNYVELTSMDNQNYIVLSNTSDLTSKEAKPKKHLVDFSFNFWDLYSSPVEMFIY